MPRTSWSALERVTNVSRRDRVVVARGDGAALHIDFPQPGVARVRLATDKQPRTGTSGVVRRTRADGGAVEERRGEILVRGPGIEIQVHADRGRLAFRDERGVPLLTTTPHGHATRGERVRLSMERQSGERIHGLGAKAAPLERSGRAWRLWNRDSVGWARGTDPLHLSVPFALISRPTRTKGRQHAGLFFDNPYALRVDLRGPDAWSIEADGGALDYLVIAGPTPADVLERYSSLTGRLPLPPRWALGYHQARWSYTPERRVRKLAEDFRARDIPCDAIHLDIDHLRGFRPFTWHDRRFPQPARLVQDLADDGFRVVPIVLPALKAGADPNTRAGLRDEHFVTDEDGQPVTGRGWAGTSYFPDFTDPETRAWWGSLHAAYAKAGIAGVWNCMAEPTTLDDATTLPLDACHVGAPGRRTHEGNHNLYASLMAQASYEGLRTHAPKRRPFVLARSGFAGVQRWAATWIAGTQSSWKHLELSVPMLLGLGVSGVPFCGTAVGGFDRHPSAELFTRWIQAACLTPLFRNHTKKGTGDQEPWSFGDAAERRARDAIRLRYRLMPYLYTCFEHASRTGAPVMRPLWWSFPDDPRAQTVEDAFLVGDDLLVAPVLERGATSRTVYFPAGRWAPLEGGAPIDGPTTERVDASMDRLPVFVRGGAIVPACDPVAHDGERPIGALHLLIVPGTEPDAVGTLYEDDGDGFEHERGAWSRTTFTGRRDGHHLAIDSTPSGRGAPRARDVELTILGVAEAPLRMTVTDTGRGFTARVPIG